MRPGCRETQSERRRDHIIEVARTLFLETGYDATTMSSIAAKIGGSKSTLWAYFNSKEELLVAVVDVLTRELQGDILNAFRLPDDLPAGLLQFCWRLGDIVQQPDALATLRLVAAESGRSPELGRLYFDRVIDVTRRELAAYLEPFIERNELRPISADKMADILLNLCTSHLRLMLWGATSDVPRDTAADAEFHVDLFLRSFSASVMPDHSAPDPG